MISTFDKHFLQPEVRLGFYIPSSIKQAWAAELEVLQVVDEICKKHSIKYFADWGTLLGTVRHGGFIPWDDDLDIVMLRPDYDRFLQVAPDNLRDRYAIHTFRNEEGFEEFHAVVMNTEHNCFEADHMRKFHGFPYNCGVDIFVLDYVYEDPAKEHERVERIKYILATADGMRDGDIAKGALENALSKIEQKEHVRINRNLSLREIWVSLYELAEKICAEVTEKESDIVTQMIPWGVKEIPHARYDVKDYEEIIRLPFEYITMPVPVSYDELLIKRYGNYLTLIRNAGAHGYPFFKSQKEQLQALLDFELPGYRWTQEEKEYVTALSSRDRNTGYKALIRECIPELDRLNKQIESAVCQDNTTDDLLSDIASAQQLAIDMGGLIEQVREMLGETGPCEVISCIESYCEKLYSLYQMFAGEVGGQMLTDRSGNGVDISLVSEAVAVAYNQLKEHLITDILDRRCVVLVAYTSEGMNTIIRCGSKDIDGLGQNNTDVYLCQVPYYYKDYDGALVEEVMDNVTCYDTNRHEVACWHADYSSYSMKYIRYDAIDMALLHPDRIYSQNYADQYDDVMSIHPAYYSNELVQCTDDYVYVQCFDLLEFASDSEREYQNMESYALMPGVTCADHIYLGAEWLRDMYLSKLTDFAGEEYASIWAEKIVVCGNEPVMADQASTPVVKYVSKNKPEIVSEPEAHKYIMYCIGEGAPIVHAERCIDKIKSNLEILRNRTDGITTIWVMNETMYDNLDRLRPELTAPIRALADEYLAAGWGELYIRRNGDTEGDRMLVDKCTGYYGDASIYVPMFVVAKKPVLIQNWDI